MNVINCCVEGIFFRNAKGEDSYFSPSKEHRVSFSYQLEVSEVERGFLPVATRSSLEIVGLPEPIPGTVFIVPGILLTILRERGCTRADLIAPGEEREDNPVWCEGQIFAVRRFRGLV